MASQHRSGESAPSDRRVLAVNGGSATLKFAIFELGDPPRRLLVGLVERVGAPDTVLRVTPVGAAEERSDLPSSGYREAVGGLVDWLHHRGELDQLVGVGHRIVHGGPGHTGPAVVTPELRRDLERLVPLDPAHLPAELALIDAISARLPSVPQVACFDTAFHRALPRVAQLLPLPHRYVDIRRYGFHGLSFEYLMGELGPEAAAGRVVLAHLGSGASLAAVCGGRCVDTTMGFTPTGGLVMGTRTGDLDPGVLVHLARTEGLTPDQLDRLVNRESGLLGVSGSSSDVRDLLARQASDPLAADAVELFCYSVRKWVGAMAATLGGIDTLVFAGGIGENAAEVRARICDGLAFLGVRLDPTRNASSESVISADGAPCAVRVIRTDEEAVIVRHTVRLLKLTPAKESADA